MEHLRVMESQYLLRSSTVNDISKALKEDSPVSILKGDFINDNVSKELDSLRDIRSSGKEYLNHDS